MPNAPARVVVRDSIEVAAESEVRLTGELRSGSVRPGMQACRSFGTFFVTARVKHVESLRGASVDEEISIAIDTPDQQTRKLWKEFCRPGDFIGSSRIRKMSSARCCPSGWTE